jgi:hypothetical protein
LVKLLFLLVIKLFPRIEIISKCIDHQENHYIIYAKDPHNQYLAWINWPRFDFWDLKMDLYLNLKAQKIKTKNSLWQVLIFNSKKKKFKNAKLF